MAAGWRMGAKMRMIDEGVHDVARDQHDEVDAQQELRGAELLGEDPVAHRLGARVHSPAD
jgi:hypothetical protein